MRQFLPFLLCIALVSPSLSSAEAETTGIFPISVTYMDAPGQCSLFTVGGGFYITASHCMAGPVKLGEEILTSIFVNKEEDIALLRGEVRGMGFKLGREPKKGDEVTAFGFPASIPVVIQIPSVYQGEFQIPNFGPPSAIYWGNAMGGMSGGPILDRKGEVVGVITGGGNPSSMLQNIGTGVRYRALRKTMQVAEMLK